MNDLSSAATQQNCLFPSRVFYHQYDISTTLAIFSKLQLKFQSLNCPFLEFTFQQTNKHLNHRIPLKKILTLSKFFVDFSMAHFTNALSFSLYSSCSCFSQFLSKYPHHNLSALSHAYRPSLCTLMHLLQSTVLLINK